MRERVLHLCLSKQKKKKSGKTTQFSLNSYPSRIRAGYPIFFLKKIFVGYIPRRTQCVPVPRTYRVRVLFTKARTRASQLGDQMNNSSLWAAYFDKEIKSTSLNWLCFSKVWYPEELWGVLFLILIWSRLRKKSCSRACTVVFFHKGRGK